MSDPRFDLANFSMNQQFTLEDDRSLVRYYYGVPDEHAVASIRLLRFMSALKEATWGFVQAEHLRSGLRLSHLFQGVLRTHATCS